MTNQRAGWILAAISFLVACAIPPLLMIGATAAVYVIIAKRLARPPRPRVYTARDYAQVKPGQLNPGDLYDTEISSKIYVWDGREWLDVQRDLQLKRAREIGKLL